MKLLGATIVIGIFAFASQKVSKVIDKIKNKILREADEKLESIFLSIPGGDGPDDVPDEFDNSRGRGGNNTPFFSEGGNSSPSFGFNEGGNSGYSDFGFNEGGSTGGDFF